MRDAIAGNVKNKRMGDLPWVGRKLISLFSHEPKMASALDVRMIAVALVMLFKGIYAAVG
jgi:hypothetical protein